MRALRLNLETNSFDQVLMSGGADARKELARQLASLLADEGTSPGERATAVAHLIKLATDPVFEVRQSVAELLSEIAPVEADLIFTIIADEDDIALQFIARSRALDLGIMFAILKAGDVLRQMQVAARHDLFADCAKHIVSHGEWSVCSALLDNPEFDPNEEDYRVLHQRFFDEPPIIDRLLARDDLPLDIRILQAKQASARLNDYLHEAAYTRSDPSRLVAEAEETATLEVLAQAPLEELGKAIAFLLTKDLLTPSLLLRAALAGEMAVVEHALSALSGIPLRRLQKLLYQRGLMSSRAIFNRCRLAPHCTRLLQAAAEVQRMGEERGEAPSPNAFGVLVIETIITRFDGLALNYKMKLLEIVESLGPERARTMAGKLKMNLTRAA
jgi:uncharacterized protein (DUF2336 family)